MDEKEFYRLVTVASPFAGDREYNLEYLRECMLDCISRREAPFAPHMMYPFLLDDDKVYERILGIDMGCTWALRGDALVVYTDLGISAGMAHEIETALQAGLCVEYRNLGSKRKNG